MNDGKTLGRLLLGAGVAAVVFYALGFGLNEYLRQRRGPWEVTFQTTAAGEPELVIRQASLGISNLTLRFAGATATNLPATVRFEVPHREVPFGRVKYDDLTYWPGVVTLDLFGHEVELLPRTLYVDRRPVAWSATGALVLAAEDGPGDAEPSQGTP